MTVEYHRYKSHISAPSSATWIPVAARAAHRWRCHKICASGSVCASQQGMEKVFLFSLCMLLTQTRTVTTKPVLSMCLKKACIHQDFRGLWWIITFCFLSFNSPSRNPSPLSLALATKPLCSPSLCGYPGALVASLHQDSLVRCWIDHLFSCLFFLSFHLPFCLLKL